MKNRVMPVIKAAVLLIIPFSHSLHAKAQALCEPFYVIGETNKGKVWHAVFEGCIEPRTPLIKADEDPQIRATVISSRKVRRITSLTSFSGDTTTEAEFFDRQGYTISTCWTTSIYGTLRDTLRVPYQNAFTENGLLSSVIYQPDGEDLTGRRWCYVVEKFKHDTSGHLTRKREITTRNFNYWNPHTSPRNFRSHRLIPFISFSHERIIYDSRGNIIRTRNGFFSRGGYAFSYDAENRLIRAFDLEPYLQNARTYEFAYNSENLPTDGTITFRDRSFGTDKAKFQYDTKKRLISHTVAHEGSLPYASTSFTYTGPSLTTITTCTNQTNCTTRKFHYNASGLISRIEQFNGEKLFSWTDYSYEFF